MKQETEGVHWRSSSSSLCVNICICVFVYLYSCISGEIFLSTWWVGGGWGQFPPSHYRLNRNWYIVVIGWRSNIVWIHSSKLSCYHSKILQNIIVGCKREWRRYIRLYRQKQRRPLEPKPSADHLTNSTLLSQQRKKLKSRTQSVKNSRVKKIKTQQCKKLKGKTQRCKKLKSKNGKSQRCKILKGKTKSVKSSRVKKVKLISVKI